MSPEHIDTGLALPQGTGGIEYGGYIQTLETYLASRFLRSARQAAGRHPSRYDYVYSPTLATGNTVLRLGVTGQQVRRGRFYGNWQLRRALELGIGAPPLKTLKLQGGRIPLLKYLT